MDGFSEQYHAYKRWAAAERTPEDYERYRGIEDFLDRIDAFIQDTSFTDSEKWGWVEGAYAELD